VAVSAAPLKERLRADLIAAMRAQAKDELRLLRTLIAAIDNAEAVPIATEGAVTPPSGTRAFGDSSGEVPRREIDSATLDALLGTEADARLAAASFCEQHGHDAEAARLRNEAELIARYRA
jgi:uncharacterized protein YqeY